MTKNKSAIFNSKYTLGNLDKKLFVKASPDDKQKSSLSIIGKSRNIWIDVVLRFFRNKWNILFFVILLSLLLTIYLSGYFLEHNPDNAVTTSGTDEIRYLKPGWFSNFNHAEWIGRNSEVTDGSAPWGTDTSWILERTKIGTNRTKIIFENRLAVKTALGTDSLGRDVLSRLVAGAKWSINLAIIVATIETIIGVSIGIYLGYHVGKTADTILMRFIEFFSAVPTLLWMFIFTLLIGTSFWSMALVLILTGWVGPIFAARMFTIKIKDAEFILAARSVGASKTRVLFGHILPNIIGRLLVSFVLRIPMVIFFETTLVFLGFKIGGENAHSIGNLINDARSLTAIKENVMYVISISSLLAIFTISAQMIANGIRDAFDPRVVK